MVHTLANINAGIAKRERRAARGGNNLVRQDQQRAVNQPAPGPRVIQRPTDNAAFRVFRDSSGASSAKAREELARQQAALDLGIKRFGEDQTRGVARGGEDRLTFRDRNLASTELNRANQVGDFNRTQERGLADSLQGFQRFRTANRLQESRGLEDFGRQEESGLLNIDRSRESAGLFSSGERLRQRTEFSGDIGTARNRLVADLGLQRQKAFQDKARLEGRLVQDVSRGVNRTNASARLRSSQLGEDFNRGSNRSAEDDTRSRGRFSEDSALRQDVLDRRVAEIMANQSSGSSRAAGINSSRQAAANRNRERSFNERGFQFTDNRAQTTTSVARQKSRSTGANRRQKGPF